MDKLTPYSNLYLRLSGQADRELSFRPIFRPDGEFTHFNIMRGTDVVGWDWDLVGALETADEIARGELQFNFELNPLPWTPEEGPSKCV